MTDRAVIYCRYSSDLQSAASLEDQTRLCKDRITREGWSLLQVYRDAAASGASSLRPGYQVLQEAVTDGAVDIVIAEAMDRLSRDQEDIAALYKRLRFAGVRLITLAEGEVSELHVGLKGTMNALFLKDLADKTRRGLRGRIAAGRSAGGRCYGFEIVRNVDARGEPVRGGRRMLEDEAAIVRQVFASFAAGHSPIAIAKQLNAEAIPGPDGGAWQDTTLRGHATRGTGLLRNELYIGRLVWNRMRFIKDPESGKRVSRPNPPEAWVREDVPELRIVDDATWETVQSRLAGIRLRSGADEPGRVRFWDRRSAQHVLTGKVVCGACGGSFSAVGKNYLACRAARKQGTCGNTASVKRGDLEGQILDGLGHQLMTPDHAAVFIAAFTAEWNRLAADSGTSQAANERELATLRRRISGLVDAIADGLRGPDVQQKLDGLAARRDVLEKQLAAPAEPMPRLHGNLSEVYRAKVAELSAHLADPTRSREAMEIVRGLIDKVEIHPGTGGGKPEAVLVGDLASMIRMSLEDPTSQAVTAARARARAASGSGLFLRSVKVVAGTGNHRELTPIRVAC